MSVTISKRISAVQFVLYINFCRNSLSRTIELFIVWTKKFHKKIFIVTDWTVKTAKVLYRKQKVIYIVWYISGIIIDPNIWQFAQIMLFDGIFSAIKEFRS